LRFDVSGLKLRKNVACGGAKFLKKRRVSWPLLYQNFGACPKIKGAKRAERTGVLRRSAFGTTQKAKSKFQKPITKNGANRTAKRPI